MIAKGYTFLYWRVYNEHRKCFWSCPAKNDVYHGTAYAALLEDILQDMVDERNRVKF